VKHTALLIEDDSDTQAVIRHFLTAAGFKVDRAASGKVGLRMVDTAPPDVVVLDLNLPDMDGTEVCRRIREGQTLPILMLTARHTLGDRLKGFDLGADDYLGKPFDPQELVARVNAILRRTRPDVLNSVPAETSLLQCGDVSVDVSKYEVKVGTADVSLTPTEFRLLVLLMREPGRMVSRREAMVAMYGNTHERDFRTVDSHVSHLRRKLEASGMRSLQITNIYGLGYKLYC